MSTTASADGLPGDVAALVYGLSSAATQPDRQQGMPAAELDDRERGQQRHRRAQRGQNLGIMRDPVRAGAGSTWTVVANSVHVQAARAAAAAGGSHLARPSRAALTSVYHHALASGFSRGLLVTAGIMLLGLVITIVAIRIRRADLAGTQQPVTAVPAAQAQPR
jgi:hypothetical protein